MLRRHLGTPQLSSIVPSGNPVQGLQQVQAGGVQRIAALYEQRRRLGRLVIAQAALEPAIGGDQGHVIGAVATDGLQQQDRVADVAIRRRRDYRTVDKGTTTVATLAQRTQAVEERTDRLETILASFMEQTDSSIRRLDGIVELLVQEGARDRAATARDREAAAQAAAQEREATARDREAVAQAAAQEREAAARDRKAMNKRWGELANKMGTVVGDIVAPSVRRLAREVFDCGDLQYFSPRVSLKRSDDRSREREFDALYVGTRAVLLNEMKSSPRSSDARAFAEFLRSNEFALYFPQYRELPIVPAFSSLSIPADMVTCLTRRGIYALAMGDEAMQVLNLEAVRSRRAAP